jgi:hypothetical protein
MSDCPHNENNTDYCSICLRAEIERLTNALEVKQASYNMLKARFKELKAEYKTLQIRCAHRGFLLWKQRYV